MTDYEEHILRSGDTLVVRLPIGTKVDTAKMVKDTLADLWQDDDIKVVVITCEQIVVVRPGESVAE